MNLGKIIAEHYPDQRFPEFWIVQYIGKESCTETFYDEKEALKFFNDLSKNLKARIIKVQENILSTDKIVYGEGLESEVLIFYPELKHVGRNGEFFDEIRKYKLIDLGPVAVEEVDNAV